MSVAEDKVVLRYKDDVVEVLKYAAHVVKWTHKGEDVIFVSSQAQFEEGKAIRGGVPVCYPQFSDMGPLTKHGFARTQGFTVDSQSESTVTLKLAPREQDLVEFPFPHELFVCVEVAEGQLSQQMRVVSAAEQPMEFTCALHTYFRVGGIDQARVVGLSGLKYLDNTNARAELEENSDVLAIAGEVDRIYLNAPNLVSIHDSVLNRRIEITKDGLGDFVVWNPWEAGAKGMKDLGDEEYKVMLCVEAAQCGSGKVLVQPGQTWTATQTLKVSSL